MKHCTVLVLCKPVMRLSMPRMPRRFWRNRGRDRHRRQHRHRRKTSHTVHARADGGRHHSAALEFVVRLRRMHKQVLLYLALPTPQTSAIQADIT